MYKIQASSSIGRATVSKTVGWGFNSSLACFIFGGGFVVKGREKFRKARR